MELTVGRNTGLESSSLHAWKQLRPYRMMELALYFERKGCRSLAAKFYSKTLEALRLAGVEESALEMEFARLRPEGNGSPARFAPSARICTN